MPIPLPVKKNKFGQRVADLDVTTYYRQIAEEVLEAHEAAVSYNTAKKIVLDGCGACLSDYDSRFEAEELVDVIACCITRIAIVPFLDDDDDLADYLAKALAECQIKFGDDFYTQLSSAVMWAYHTAESEKFFHVLYNACGNCLADIPAYHFNEESALTDIIALCIHRLEVLGYDESKRRELYQAVNDKNKKRGYLED